MDAFNWAAKGNPPRQFPEFPARKLKKRPGCAGHPIKSQLLPALDLPCEAKSWRTGVWGSVEVPRKFYRVPRRAIPALRPAAKVKKVPLVQVKAVSADGTDTERLIINRQDSWQKNEELAKKLQEKARKKIGQKRHRN